MTVSYEDLKQVNLGFEKDFQQAFQAIIESGWYILGQQVLSFEKAFAQYVGVKHANRCR